MISREQIDAVLGDGRIVTGTDGQDLGRIGQVLTDALSDRPVWMTVASAKRGGVDALVPLALARFDDGRISVPYSAAVVRGAPRGSTAGGSLGRRHEADLVRYYGLGDVGTPGVTTGRLPSRREWRLPCTGSSVRALRLELRPYLDGTGLPGDQLDDLVLATSEAAKNAVEHARTPLAGFLDVRVDMDGKGVLITIRDYGLWRDPVPGTGRGRGLLLMRNLSALTVTAARDGTTVTLANRYADLGRWSFRHRR